jgi:hypothetical protein
LPEIARAGHRQTRSCARHRIGAIRLRGDTLDQQIDFGDIEPGHIQAEVEIDLGEFAQLLAEQPVVPGADFGQSIIGDGKRLGLLGAQMLEADRRNLSKPQLPRRHQAAMPGDHPQLGVDQDWNVEAKGFYTSGDLPDLPLAVFFWIARIGFEPIDGLVPDCRQTGARPVAGIREQVRRHVVKTPGS